MTSQPVIHGGPGDVPDGWGAAWSPLERAADPSGPSCPSCGGTRTHWDAAPLPGGHARGGDADRWRCEQGHSFVVGADGSAQAEVPPC